MTGKKRALEEHIEAIAAELCERTARDFDGLNGEPPEWVPESVRAEFHRLRPELFAFAERLRAHLAGLPEEAIPEPLRQALGSAETLAHALLKDRVARLRAEQAALAAADRAGESALGASLDFLARFDLAMIPPRMRAVISRVALLSFAVELGPSEGRRALLGRDPLRVAGGRKRAEQRRREAALVDERIASEALKFRDFYGRTRVAKRVARALGLKPSRVRAALRRKRRAS
ncbi:MAG: hypothetical protein RML56_07810 [Burkholderiales bacterium]|nr:hypothetical protein [Burkholderiales bacterium]